MQLIGFMGQAGSGKDTAADYLVEHYKFVRVAAADTMKEDLCSYLDMDLETLESIKNKELSLIDTTDSHADEMIDYGTLSIRRFLQLYGMDMRYRMHDNYWLERSISEKISELNSYGCTKIVISDIRFRNEFNYVKSQGRVFFIEGRHVLRDEQARHISESFVNEPNSKNLCNAIIDNSQDFKHLHNQLDEAMQ